MIRWVAIAFASCGLWVATARGQGQSAAAVAPALPPLPAPPLAFEVGGGEPITLEEVLHSVEAHHPVIEAARARLAAAAGTRLAAEGAFDPVLAGTGWIAPLGYHRYGRAEVTVTQPTPLWGTTFVAGWRLGRELDGSSIPEYYGHTRTLDAGEIRGGVVVPLWRDGPIDGRRATLERAERGEDAARHEVETRVLRTEFAAAEAYYRWVAAGARARVALDLLRIAEERDRQIAARVAAGAIPAIEHLENRRSVFERRQGLVAARRALERSAIALSLYLRDEMGAPRVPTLANVPVEVELTGIGAGDEAQLLEHAFRDRPELVRLQELRRAAEVQVQYAENQIAPRIDLGMLASADMGGGTEASAASYRAPVLETWVTLQLPLGMREARGRAEAARAELAAVEAEAELTRDQIGIEVRDALSALRAAEGALEQARATAVAAEDVARGERVRFENGATSLLMVNLRESAAAQALAAVADAEADLRIARAWLAVAIGQHLR